MRHGFAITRLATIVAFAVGHWSTAYAGSSLKVVAAPGDAQQSPTAKEGSSFKVVTLPGGANQAQAQAPAVPHADEPMPGAAPPSEPVAGEQQMTNGITISLPGAQQVRLPSSSAREVSFNQPFAGVHISNPAVVDVAPITDHSVILTATRQGNADVYFSDITGKITNVLAVSVDDFNYDKRNPQNDTEVGAYGYLDVHNKAELDSQTHFRCRWNGCQYVGETTVSEPAPLPVGYSSSTSSLNYSGGLSGGPQAVPGAPPAPAPPR